MSRNRFENGKTFLMDGHFCAITKILVGKRFEIFNRSLNGTDIKTLNDLEAKWKKGEVIFFPEVKEEFSKQVDLEKKEYAFADFQSIPKKNWETAWVRYCVIFPLFQKSPKETTRTKIKEYVKTFSIDVVPKYLLIGADPVIVGILSTLSLPWTGVEEWLKRLRSSGGDIRSLVPAYEKRGGRHQKRIHAEAEKKINETFEECAEDEQRHTIESVWMMFVNKLDEANKGRPDDLKIPKPGQGTFYKRLSEHPKKSAILGNKKSKIENKAEEGSYSAAFEANWIMDVIEIDHTTMDIVVVDDRSFLPIGRPTLTIAICRKSRMPAGYYIGFEPASYLTVMQCLLHTILPKDDVKAKSGTTKPWPVRGTPGIVLTDDAQEFIGKDLKDACAQLNINLIHCPVQEPWAKAIVERFIKTINLELLHELKGTTFSNPLEKGDDNPFEHACIRESTFREIFDLYLVDDYSQDFNTGIDAIPFNVWMRDEIAGFVPEMPDSVKDLRTILSRSADRVIQRIGIEFETLEYQSEELQLLRAILPEDERGVKIKYDPSDLGSIGVLDKSTIPEKWINVPAVNQAYAKGLSLWAHKVLRSIVLAEKGSVDEEALAATKAKIRKKAQEDFIKAKKSKGRVFLARLLKAIMGPDSEKPSEQPEPVATNPSEPKKPKATKPKGSEDKGTPSQPPKVAPLEMTATLPAQYEVDFSLPD